LKLLLVHHFALTSITGVTVMNAELLARIPAVDPAIEVSYLPLEQFADPRSLVDFLERTHADASCVIGANIHIEVLWDLSLALARWCAAHSIPLYDNVQDYWPHHRESLAQLTGECSVVLAGASPFIVDSLAAAGFPALSLPMGAQLPPGVSSRRQSPQVIASVGRLIRRKRFADVARAFCSAGLDKSETLCLTLLRSQVFSPAQDEEQLSAIRNEIERPGVRTDAIQLSFVPTVPPDYSSYSVYVCASDYEGFSMPPFEAAYCGCPPIISDIPPHRRMAVALFGDGAPDFLFPVGATDVLADRLKDEIATGRRQALVLAHHAHIRSMVESRFSLQVTARAFAQLCRDAALTGRDGGGRAS
jgi:glycosyltransferase involved in cell wall biosynthesis